MVKGCERHGKRAKLNVKVLSWCQIVTHLHVPIAC